MLLPGLLLGAALDAAGMRFFNGAGIYTAFPDFSSVTLTNASLLGNLLMLRPFVVPTFGSNGMLYLLSYLFWSFILLFALVRGAPAWTCRRRWASGSCAPNTCWSGPGSRPSRAPCIRTAPP
jgi:hypothetical protein